MAGGRQAWCPRCDELRAARTGAACPVCGRQLLAVPSERPGQPRPRRLDRVAGRLRALLPPAGAVGAALLVVAAVAGAFTAGRLTRTTPSAPGAAPASTVPGFLDEGPDTGRRDFNWQAQAGGLTVRLRSLTVGTGFSRLELHVDGVRRGRDVSALERLRIRDGAGNDLLPGGELAAISTAASRPASGGGIDTEVVLDRALDLQAVAAVELGGLRVARYVEETLRGTLVDRELQQRVNSEDPASTQWLAGRRDCPACRLRVTCEDCRSLRLAGASYQLGRILILTEAVGPVERTALNPSRRRVVVSDPGGVGELEGWIDGTGSTAVISASGEQLAAATRLQGANPGDPMEFRAVVQAQAEQAVRGPWTIRQPGGSG
jgi:hypothetical protein